MNVRRVIRLIACPPFSCARNPGTRGQTTQPGSRDSRALEFVEIRLRLEAREAAGACKPRPGVFVMTSGWRVDSGLRRPGRRVCRRAVLVHGHLPRAIHSQAPTRERRDGSRRLPRSPGAQLLGACHQALLSAAVTIGRGSPADAPIITRRAIEAACLAVAINHDPTNRDKWIAAERRLWRWADRRKGVKPKQPSKSVVYPASPLVESLRAKLEIMSDAGVHFAVGFLSMQRWRAERPPDSALPGPALVRFAYPESSRRELERALMFLTSVHCEILDVFVGCFDGVFYRDAQWLRMRRNIARQGQLLVKPFRLEARNDKRS